MNKKYLLLAKNSQDNKKEIENENLPVTFSGNGHRLRNYRIYGNTGGVGDLQANGKYLVPVTVSGKNLAPTILPQSSGGINIQQIGDGIYSMSGTSQKQNNFVFTLNLSLPIGDYKIVNMGTVRIALDFKNISGATVFKSPNPGEAMSFSYPDNAQRGINIYVPILSNDTVDGTVKYMIIRASGEYNSYEPYHEPQTVNIELDEPLRKVNDAFDYVDFKQQKLYQKIYCKILNGNETWFADSSADSNAVFRTTLKIKEPYQNYTSTEYTAQKSYGNVLLNDKSFCIGSTAIVIHDEFYAAETKERSLELFVAALKTKYLSNQPVKIYYSDAATEKSVLLPALPTIDGTNIITVDTETQPSKIYLQGNITEIETVSAQALQANIQSLQPLSLDDENLELDVMPIDKSEIQTDYISETPVENTDESEQEENIIENTGDDENAE